MQQTFLLDVKQEHKCVLIYCSKEKQENAVKSSRQIENLDNTGLAWALPQTEALKRKQKF